MMGPAQYTAQVLGILRREHVPATFFVLGQNVRARPGLVRRMIREGHEVGNHSWQHELNPSWSSLRRTSVAVREAAGVWPTTMRPPYGYFTTPLVHHAGTLGMTTVRWDVDPSDWSTPGTEAIARRASIGGPGAIVLMHDAGGMRSQTVAALPTIIASYRARGFQFVTADEMLGIRHR